MAKRFLGRKVVRVLLVLLVCFVLIQFIRPGLDNPPVTGDLQAPPAVKALLQRACYDCHSNETKLLWFDVINPPYWLVAEHVKEGRRLLNFSHWDSLNVDQQKGKLFESLNQIVFKEMPLSQYTTFHGDARVSDADIKVLRQYLATLSPPRLADSASVSRADTQYARWAAVGGAPVTDVKPEPDGFAFIPGYMDWEAISSTERWDNGTMRVITGNPVAVKAIREGHTNPWPDGTAFAKIAWKGLMDPDGRIRPGEFLQVEFMLKDKEKYASTGGWGWGRWKGDELKPYGKGRMFAMECVHCHQPMKNFDLVFSSPVYWPGKAARDTAGLDVLSWKVVSSDIDKSSRIMSTLYGNDAAVTAARKGMRYPAGAQLALVRWRQREDEHWYGANVPDSIISIEKVSIGPKGTRADCRTYVGPTRTDSSACDLLMQYITSRRASVMR